MFVYKHTETIEYVESNLLFKYKTSRVNNSRILRVKNAKFSWLLYEPEHKVKFSSLH